jgi:hypothetical protein
MVDCAIILISHKEELNFFNEISLLQLKKVLGKKWPTYMICPKKNNVSAFLDLVSDLKIIRIEDWWLSDYNRFGRYKLSPSLYGKFLKYKYLLFYELDCFVFSDQLEFWMAKNYDYIGAPWYEHFHNSNHNSKLIDMGNGGFSLRKTKTMYFLSYINNLFRGKKYERINIQEDMIWTRNILPHYPFSKVPKSEEALQFAFETNPEKAYETIGKKMPFGVHAWFKNKRYFDFYRPFIEKEGYELGAFDLMTQE